MSQNTHAGATPPALPKKPSSRLALIATIVAILLILPTALVIWYVSVRSSNASAIRKLENEVRQRGEPLTLADLQAKYSPIPDEENAAVALTEIWSAEEPLFWEAFFNDERPLHRRATEKYDPALPYLGSDAKRIPRVSPLNSNTLAAAESYLHAKSSHLEAVRAAMRRLHFRFPVNIEDGPYALLPHLSLLKTEAQNFRIAALVASERGDKDAAISDLRHTARTGQLLADEPVLISQLVRIACLSFAMDGTEQLMSRQALTVDELQTLRLFLEELNLHGVARSSLVNERPFSLCIFDPNMVVRGAAEGPSDEGSGNPEARALGIRTSFGIMQSVGYLDPDRRLMLETFRDAIDLAGQETPESLMKIDELFEATSRKARKFPPKRFYTMMLTGLQNVPLRFATFEARRRAALIAIAVERYRLDHAGQIPETIEPLVPAYLPAIPSDPLDGQPMRFHKLEHGFVVYSVGGDREDNGGKGQVQGAFEHTDVTFIVER